MENVCILVDVSITCLYLHGLLLFQYNNFLKKPLNTY